MGRCLIDSRTTDAVAISHRDMTSTAQYALLQLATGATAMNAASGQNLSLAIAASTRWRVNGSTLAWEPGSDNALDFGATTSNRVRRMFVAEYWEGSEMTAPAAPAANKFRLYSEDNGSGKTRLVVLFPTGAAQVIATEP